MNNIRKKNHQKTCLIIPSRYSSIPPSLMRILDNSTEFSAFYVADTGVEGAGKRRLIHSRQHSMPFTNFRVIPNLSSVVNALQPDLVCLEEEVINTAAVHIVGIRRRLGSRFRLILLVNRPSERTLIAEKMHMALAPSRNLLNNTDALIAFDWNSVHRYRSIGYNGKVLHVQRTLIDVKEYPTHETLVYHAARHDVFAAAFVAHSPDDLDFIRSTASLLDFPHAVSVFAPSNLPASAHGGFARHGFSERSGNVLNNIDALVILRSPEECVRELAVRAMACGAPIAAPASALPEDFIGPSGIVYQDYDAVDLAQSLHLIHARNSLETALRVRQWANNNFDERRTKKRLTSLFADLCVERTYDVESLSPRID